MKRFRDLSIIEKKGINFVIACDSCGGIGLKEFDDIKADPELVAYNTAKVAILEVMAYRADPIMIVNTISNEYNVYGEKMLRGINRALAEINKCDSINGSTEENFKTRMTALGVTVIAEDKKLFRKPQKGEVILSIGECLFGESLLKNYDEAFSIGDMKKLLEYDFINDILPVGSKGILYEINNIISQTDLNIKYRESDIDLYASAGPSTVVLCTLKEENIKKIKISKKLRIIADLC